MNRFMRYLEIDLSLEVLIFKTEIKEFTSKVSINKKEVKELKIKKEAVLFTSFDEDENKDYFIITIYPKNNFLISIEYTLKEKNYEEDFKQFKEYLKTLIL